MTVNDRDARAASSECFKERAERLGLTMDDEHMKILQQIVRENDAVMAAVIDSSRVPSEDPSDFVRLLHAWRQRHAD
jgi:hypothetical protein